MGVIFSHGLQPDQMAAQAGGAWITAIPDALRIFIALAEFLGGVGVILPALTKIQPRLTPLAASGLVLMMALAIPFHLGRGEYPNAILNLILLVLAGVVAYGRFNLRPIRRT